MAPNLTAVTAVAKFPYPVRTTERAPGRASESTSSTSKPLPPFKRMSTTANAGGDRRMIAIPSSTLSAVCTSNPREVNARDNRFKND